MTEQEKDILILKILGRPQSLTEDEVSFILSDQELLDIYNTSIKVKNAVSPSIKIDPAKEWELMRARIQASHKKDKTSSEGSSVFKNEEDKKSFIASFLRNLSKRPVAASIGTFLLFGALATGLLWNPKPIQNEGDLNGMAHAEPKTNSISLVSNTLDELSKANGEDLIDHSKEETKKKTSSNKEFVNSDTEKDRSNSAQGKPVPSNTLNISNPSSENQKQPPLNSLTNPTEDIALNIDKPAFEDLAYSQDNINENINEYELDQLDCLWPEDWDIDECVRLQQARLDNQIAMVIAEGQKKEFEVYRQNLLMEYEITNPDADKAAVQKFEEDIEKTFGRFYSVLP